MEKIRTKMPELLVFARAAALGFASAEIFHVAHIGGNGLAALVDHFDPSIRLGLVAIVFVLLASYSASRGIAGNALRLWRSQSAYFSPSWTAFQADRGRDFSAIVDGISN